MQKILGVPAEMWVFPCMTVPREGTAPVQPAPYRIEAAVPVDDEFLFLEPEPEDGEPNRDDDGFESLTSHATGYGYGYRYEDNDEDLDVSDGGN